jgi:hypothetical protein
MTMRHATIMPDEGHTIRPLIRPSDDPLIRRGRMTLQSSERMRLVCAAGA